jgi:hypothetical protein
MNVEELRRELRDQMEWKDRLIQMVYFSGGQDRRHAGHILLLQEQYVKLLQAKIELQGNGSLAPKRKCELEAVLKTWKEEFRSQYIEAKEDLWRWRRSRTPPKEPQSSPQPIQQTKVKWIGSEIEFGQWVTDAFAKGWIAATSQTNALDKVGEHFLQKDGRPMKGRNIKQNLNNSYRAKKYKPA